MHTDVDAVTDGRACSYRTFGGATGVFRSRRVSSPTVRTELVVEDRIMLNGTPCLLHLSPDMTVTHHFRPIIGNVHSSSVWYTQACHPSGNVLERT